MDINKIVKVVVFYKTLVYLKYSKAPLIFQSVALPRFSLNIDKKNMFFTNAV